MLNSAIVGRVRKRVKIAVAAIGEVWQQQQEAGPAPNPRGPPASCSAVLSVSKTAFLPEHDTPENDEWQPHNHHGGHKTKGRMQPTGAPQPASGWDRRG
jgi:hypothetical protein